MSADSVEQQARPAQREHIPLAIFYMISAGFVFSGSSAASKWLVATYPVGEVLFSRALFSFLGISVFIFPAYGFAVYRTNRPGAHVMRSVSQTISQTLLMIAFSMMPLASATAINFSAPLFATIASIVLLKESVGLTRWVVLIAGFVGVLFVTNPGADTFQIGALYALGNAVLFGTVTAGVRGMTSTESAETLAIWQMTLLAGVYVLMLPFGFLMPTGFDFGLMLLSGLTNAVGQYLWTRALHLAPTSAVVPFQYLSLIWAMLLGYAVWGDVPTLSLLIGSAIVVASGLFLLWREARKIKVTQVALR